MKYSQLNYLINQVIFLDLQVKNRESISFIIKNNEVFIANDLKFFHQESAFDFDTICLNDEDIALLDYVYEYYLSKEFIIKHNSNLLKIIYFFTNEKYLKNSFTDDHGRIVKESVSEKYLKYLEIPIVDILIRSFIHKLNIEIHNNFKITLTCDYDILNFWSGISKKSKFKLFFNYIKKKQFSLFTNQLLSFLFSRFTSQYNFYLAKNMYLFEEFFSKSIEVKNIAFLLIDNSNKKYDFKNQYNKRILKFLTDLKNQGVELALHPSYDSSGNEKLIKKQLSKFTNLFGKTDKVRYHYLRIDYQKDLNILEKNHFYFDYSFAFANSLLFRGGITKRFKMWNNIDAKPFSLTIVPLTIMDGTLFDYLGYDRDSDFFEISKKIDLSFDYGFEITTLIHNNGMTSMATKKDISYNLNNLILNFVKKKLERQDAN
jgi:hypothetical protein